MRPFRFLCACVVLALCATLPARGQSPENWQQEVHYDMDITLHANEHQYTGQQTLRYTNNSPDTLHTVYYHLYFNAFHPHSMMAERNRHVPDPDGRIVPRIFNLDEDERGWHRIRSITQDGTPVDSKIRDTVMEVPLAEPIPPGATSTFRMHWRAQIPLQTRRSGRDSRGGGIDFSMTQWYPKMAEYDERGWHADPYVMREFYAPYGTFDVRITAPAEYTLGGSGVLQNPEAVGHGYDLEGSGTWRPSDGAPAADSLTWHFLAADVHDFAWAADPDYIHDKVEADGVTHHILYKPDVASSWERLKDDMPRLTRFFNAQYGTYPYPQMTVAQGGDGGMEYPMITLVAGYDNPEFEEKDGPLSILGTTIHEFAHMWYYAALGTNESDYAWMDEGFTSYATSEGFAHLTGGTASHSPQSIAQLQRLGLFEPFSTPADWFQTNTAYGVASYSGGEMLVAMLGYVIGDAQRDAWLKRYLRERKFQHPDPFDIELFAEQVSGMKLDWYFWQFTETTRQLDDAIDEVEQTATADGVEVTLELERKGTAVMPHDVELTLADGSTQMVHVPLLITHGHKPVPEDWIVTDPWPWVYPEKEFTVTVPARVTAATLDPEGRTPDVNRLNNSMDVPVETRFLRAPQANVNAYEVGVRPLGSYADRFGVGVGVQARGQYLNRYASRATLTLWPEVLLSGGSDPSPEGTSTWFDGLDYELSVRAPLPYVDPRASIEVASAKHIGFMENRVTASTPLSPLLGDGSQTLSASILHQWNPSDRVFASRIVRRLDPTVPEDPVSPPAQRRVPLTPFDETSNLSARLRYDAAQGADRIAAELEVGASLRDASSSPGSVTRFAVEATKTHAFSSLLTGRADLQVGFASSDLFRHKEFVLGGRSLEEQWRADAYRQGSSVFAEPVTDAHLVAFGAAGPVAYLRNDTGGRSLIRGNNVVAGRLSLHARPFGAVNALSPLGLEVFTGVGSAWGDNARFFFRDLVLEDFVGDAGFGASYTIGAIPHLDRWTAQSDVLQDLEIVARFPVWASNPDFIDFGQEEFAFRWLLGVQIRP